MKLLVAVKRVVDYNVTLVDKLRNEAKVMPFDHPSALRGAKSRAFKGM